MATSSIFQTVLIKDKKLIGRFVSALEGSQRSRSKRTEYSRPVEHVEDTDRIRKILGAEADDGIQDPDGR